MAQSSFYDTGHKGDCVSVLICNSVQNSYNFRMGKIITLIFIILLAAASATGYFYLNDKIQGGEKKIAEGQKQIKDGEQMLKAGKAKLAAGKQRLSKGKQQYHAASSIPFDQLSQALPEGTVLFQVAKSKVAEGGKQIASGEKQVAAGEKKIRAGEARLKEGKQQLSAGVAKLEQAKQYRFMCGIAALFFTFLTLLLIISWRRSFFKSSAH